MADLIYVTKIMKRVLGIKGRSKFLNERSHQFLKVAGISYDHRVENGGGMSLLLMPENAERLESFYRAWMKTAIFAQLDAVKESTHDD